MTSLVDNASPEGDQTEFDCTPGFAWAVHVFTSMGIVATFLGLLSVLDGSPRAAIGWLTVAMIIDGLDGPIARKYRISQVIPHIDGNSLDLMIDYSACVVAPALFLHRFLLHRHDNTSLVLVGLILVSSLYLMSNKDIQTKDAYFRGFPAMWNLVIACLFALQSPPVVTKVVVITLVVFTFIPVKFIHPIRVKDFRLITIPVLVVWLAAQLYVVWILDDETADCSRSCLPAPARVAQFLIYVGAAWIVGVGIWRTFRGDPPELDEPAVRTDLHAH